MKDRVGVLSQIVGLIEKVAALEKKYGFFDLIKSVLLLAMIGLLGYAVLDPGGIADRIERFRQREHQERLSQRIRAEPEIRLHLDRLRLTLGAERVSLMEFHNGSRNLSDVPFLYADMRYESADTTMIAWQYQNISLSHYPLASMLFERGYWYGTTEELERVDRRMAGSMRMNGIGYVAFLLLETPDTPLGMLSVTYTSDSLALAEKQKLGGSIRRTGAALCGLLTK